MTEEQPAEVDYDRFLYRCPIATPITADKPKMTKKVYALVRKAVTTEGAKKKKALLKGIKDVTKAVRKGAKGLVILGADVSPYDVVSHMPVMLEEAQIPFVWVPSRQDLGTAAMSKRATSVILVKRFTEIESNFDKVCAAIEELNGEAAA